MAHVFSHPILLDFHEQIGLFRELVGGAEDGPLWNAPPGWTNSAGVLARHVCGNVSHHVGRGILGTGYARDRDAEFSAPAWDRRTLVDGLDSAADLLERLDASVSDAAWAAPWTSPDPRTYASLEQFLSRMSCHAAYHRGQAVVVLRLASLPAA